MKNIKKIIVFVFVLVSAVSFCACEKHTHNFVSAYDYNKMEYVKSCKSCEQKEVTKAGSAEYPYLANSEDSLHRIADVVDENSHINLSCDITVTSVDFENVYTFSKGCILDLCGHEVKVAKAPGCFVVEGQNVTIQNGSVNVINGGSYALFVGDESENNSVIVKNITSNAGINVFNCVAKIIDCNINASERDYYAVWGDENARVTIESGNYIGGEVACVRSYSQENIMVLNGGTFNGKIIATYKTIINGGDINGDVVLTEYKSVGPELVVNKTYNKPLNIICANGYNILTNQDENQNKVYTVEKIPDNA